MNEADREAFKAACMEWHTNSGGKDLGEFMFEAALAYAVVQPVSRSLKLNRSIETWEKCDPAAMAKQSEAAIMYALQDAREDILKLHAAINKAEAQQ